MNTLKDFVKTVILTYNSLLDVSDGAPLADILVNPNVGMLDEFVSQLNYFYQVLGITNPENITAAELDAVASNFLVYRNQGSNTTGTVEMFYSAPTSLTVPAGTKFTTATGESYSTTTTFTITANAMAGNIWNFPLYSTGPINVIADDVGTRYSIAPNSINATDFSPAPVSVTNSTSFSGGVDAENNTDFAGRFFSSVISRSFGSALSTKVSLTEYFPTVKKVTVKGMNDPEMLRDVAYSGLYTYNTKKIVDFYSKVSGVSEPPYPESLAYWTLFYDDPTTSGILPDLPPAEAFELEFSNDQYSGIFRLNDALQAQLNTNVILQESFAGAIPTTWHTSDASMGIDVLRDAEEIISDNFRARLGHTVTASGVDAQSFPVSSITIYKLLNELKGLNIVPTQRTVNTYTDLQNLWS